MLPLQTIKQINSMEIKSIKIENNDIIDVIVTALEGGSNYWYNLPDLSMVEKVKGRAQSENIAIAALSGISIPVYDLGDEEECLGQLSKENIERGIRLYIEDGRGFDAGMDADEADVLFQFMVMGEITFA